MKKKILLSVLCICMVLVMMPTMVFAEGEAPAPPPTTTENVVTDPAPPATDEVVTPSFGFAQPIVYKTSETQKSITVNLTESYTEATWKIYDNDTNADPNNGISGANSGNVLTLTKETDVPVDTYYIAMDKHGQTSPRVPLTIAWADAGAIRAKTGESYILDWNIDLVMYKQDNSQTLSGISYQVDSGSSANTNYTISSDGTTVTFTNDQITAIVGDVGDVKIVTFKFHYTGGPSDGADKTIDMFIRQSVEERPLIQGNNSTWQSGSASGLDFATNGRPEWLVDVLVDGKLIKRNSDYTLNNGTPATPKMLEGAGDSIVISLTQTYLSLLSTGPHTIEMLLNDNNKSQVARAFAVPEPATNDIPVWAWTSHAKGNFTVTGGGGYFPPYIPPTPEPVIPPVEPVVPPVEPVEPTPEPTPEPVTPDKPKHDSNTPQTGDESNMWIWLSLFGISGVGLGSLLAVKRRKI